MTKTYLGDGAYAEFDGYGIALTAENGISITDRVYLEPEVYRALVTFVDGLGSSRQVAALQQSQDPAVAALDKAVLAVEDVARRVPPQVPYGEAAHWVRSCIEPIRAIQRDLS